MSRSSYSFPIAFKQTAALPSIPLISRNYLWTHLNSLPGRFCFQTYAAHFFCFDFPAVPLLFLSNLASALLHSIESALNRYQQWCSHLQTERFVYILALLDLSAAFNTHDHSYPALCYFSLHDSVVLWFSSHLSYCTIMGSMGEALPLLSLSLSESSGTYS